MKEMLNKYKTGLLVIGAGIMACMGKWCDIQEENRAEKRLKDMEDRLDSLEAAKDEEA